MVRAVMLIGLAFFLRYDRSIVSMNEFSYIVSLLVIHETTKFQAILNMGVTNHNCKNV